MTSSGPVRDASVRTFAAVGIFLGTLVLFLPVVRCGWVNWDDPQILLDHVRWRGLTPENLRWMWTSFHMGHYQPLTWISYALDYELWGLNPAGIHLTSLLLHACTAVMLFLAADLWLRRWCDSWSGRPMDLFALTLAVLFWAWHPLRVEPVAWATARRDVLSGAGLAAMFWLAARSAVAAAGSLPFRRGGVWVAWLAAMGAKLQSFVAPVLLWVVEVTPAWVQGGWRSVRQATVSVWRAWWPMVVVSLITAALAWYGARSSGAMVSWKELGWLDRTVQAGGALFHYTWKTLWPNGLSPLYIRPAAAEWWAHPRWMASVLGWGIFVAALLWRQGRSAWTPVALWVLVALAPVLGFAQSGPQFAADRYTYVASWALIPLAALGFRRLAEKLAASGVRARPWIAVTGAALVWVVVEMTALTRQQIAVWHDSVSLWAHALEVDPGNAIAYHNLGQAIEEVEGLEAALKCYDRALELQPHMIRPRVARATARAKLGNLDGAEADLADVLSRYPDHLGAQTAWANLRLLRGQTNEALQLYAHLAEQHPDDPDVLYNWATLQLKASNPSQARDLLERLVGLRPDHALAWHNLGVARHRLGDLQGAQAAYQRALELDPSLTRLHERAPSSGVPP